jgi:histidinol-phosphate aminotransferase
MAINPHLVKPYLLGVQGYKGGKAASTVASDRKVYKLSSNENPVGPSPKAVAAIRAMSDQLHIYPDNTPERLYTALGKYYGVSADYFIAGNSGSEMIELLMTAFIREGDEVVISNPAFLVYNMFSKWRGCTAVDVPLLAPDYSLDVDGILNAVTDRTRMVFLTSPNNPTGSHIPAAQIEQIVAGVPDHVIVVLDEVYYRFATAADYTIAMPYVQQGKQIIGINSYSKTHGLAGLRLGYMYTTAELATYIRGAVRPFLINSVGMEAAIAALDDEVWVESVVKLVQDQKARIYTALSQAGIKYWPTQANFILTKPSDEARLIQHLEQHAIMVRPVTSFGAPGCVRISVGDEEATDVLIHALSQY